MTCFWNSIISKLTNEDFYLLTGNKSKLNPQDFVNLLKKKNTICENILVNDKILSKISLEEQFEWIKDYNTSGISNGHLTGTCDPFLILISDLFKVDIHHHYSGSLKGYKFHSIITYKNPLSIKTLYFQSNPSHFYCK